MTVLSTDVLVIGGGATGTGIAWDATLRGFDVILVDRADLAEGTSGRFHGLLHSGGRYAVKDPHAAEECIAENVILRKVAADCIEDTGGFFVTTPFDDPAYADRFAEGCRATGVPCEEIDPAQALREEPRLHPEISRVFRVPDGNIEVWKMVGAMARGAQQRGARVLTYHGVIAIHRDGDEVTGARVRDERTGQETDVEARVTVNAAGAWAGHIAEMAGIDGVRILPGRGIMIAMNHRLVNTVINRCTMPSDGDIIVPIRTVSVIGTTDVHTEDPDDHTVHQNEVDAMLDEGERLVPGFRQARALRVWTGVRPLFEDSKAADTDSRDVTRSHALLDHAQRDGVGALRDDDRRKAHDLPAHGPGHGRRRLPPAWGTARLHDRHRPVARLRGRRAVQARRPAGPQGRAPARRAAHLRVRAGPAQPARGRHAPPRHAQPRRHPPRAAPGHGPVPGRLLHLPRDRDPARPGRDDRRAGQRRAA